MKFTILLKCEDTPATPLTLLEIDRTDAPTAATLGMALVESKQLLGKLQQALVESRFHCHVEGQRICPPGPEGLSYRSLQEPVWPDRFTSSLSFRMCLRGPA